MNVHNSARRRALLDIYRAHHKGRCGVLSLKQIERDWKQTGLRRSDLDLALKTLQQQQLLIPTRTRDGIFYEMTYLGECAMQFVTAGGALTMVRDWFTLRRAKLRQGVRSITEGRMQNRRADDHPYLPASTGRTKK